MNNALIFPTLKNDASTLLLTKLSQSIVCDFKRWAKKDDAVESIPRLAKIGFKGISGKKHDLI